MHPGAILLIVAIVRAVVAYQKRSSTAQPAPKAKKASSSPRKPAGRLIIWWIVVTRFAIAAADAARQGWTPGWFIVAAMLMLSFPWWVARHLLIPLGLARPAAWATRLSLFFWSRDRVGGSAAAAAWALLHRSKPRPEMEARIEQWISNQRPVLAGGIFARALLAVRRGDLESARRLMESIHGLNPIAAVWICRVHANDWLVADATERGDWRRVVELTESGRASSRLSRFLRSVALRFQKGGEANRPEIVLRWLLAPRRVRTFELMRRAIAAPPEPIEAGIAEAPLQEPLARAVALHIGALKSEGEISAHGLCAVGLGWDVALSDQSTAAGFLRRAAELQITDPGDPTGRLKTAAADDLATLVRQSGVEWANLGSSGDVLLTAGREAREALLSGIELCADRLNQRVDEERALPVMDEWQEFTNLQAMYRKAREAGGTDLGRMVFDRVHTGVCNLAVWLYNKRGQKPLAHAMMTWLLAEAEAVGDVEAIRLQTKNVGLGCGV